MQIKTKRLVLVPLEQKYASDLLELWGNEEVIRYTNARQLSSLKEVEEKIDLFLKGDTADIYTSHFIVLKGKDVLGIAGLPIVNQEANIYGMYYQLIEKSWNKGYGTEVAKALIDYACNVVQAECVIADAITVNKASMRILQSIGFKQVDVDECGFTRNGKTYDIANFKYTVE